MLEYFILYIGVLNEDKFIVTCIDLKIFSAFSVSQQYAVV